MNRFWILVALGTIVLPRPAAALTFLELSTGDEALLPDARAAALGRTRSVDTMGGFTVGWNPALLPRLDGVEVGLGGGVQKLRETRSTPAFDSFDGFLVNSIYVLNDEYQYQSGVGVSGAWAPEGFQGRLGLGASYQPLWDFQYDYVEEVRDNNAFTQPRDRLIALNQIQSDGTIGATSLGAGFAPREEISFGAAVQFLNGRQDLVQRTLLFDPDSRTQALSRIRSLSGTRFLLALSGRPRPSLDASVTWRTKTDLRGSFLRDGDPGELDYFGLQDSTTVAGSVDITYPHEVSVGIAYRPRAKVRTTIRAEAGWTQWSEFEHDLYGDLGLNDIWDARVGIEHTFYNGLPVRFGFRYRPSPLDDEVATTAFTFGGGLDVGPLRADLGFELADREYRFEDLFADSMFGGNDHTQKDLVEENATFAYVTLSYQIESGE